MNIQYTELDNLMMAYNLNYNQRKQINHYIKENYVEKSKIIKLKNEL